MGSTIPFTFGIALVPRANARDWPLVEALLDLTLASVRAQTDPDFRVLLACHDRPRLRWDDPRVELVEAGWPVEPPDPHNDDSGRKKHALNDLVLARGGGLLMLLDADDWVDTRLVEAARAAVGPDVVGAVVEDGLAVDFRTLRRQRSPTHASSPTRSTASAARAPWPTSGRTPPTRCGATRSPRCARTTAGPRRRTSWGCGWRDSRSKAPT